MRILSKALVVAVGLLLTGAAVASADTCFQDSFGQVLIGKSFLLPTANNCKPFNGFIKDRYTPLSGNVCKTWNNTYYIFNLQFGLGQFSDGGSVVFFLEVPTLHGGGNYLNWDTGNGDGFIDSFTIDKVLCPSVRRFGP